MNETITTILNRSSVRNYADTPCTEEQLTHLQNAALAAPSARNRQPWHFSFVCNKQIIDQLELIMAQDANKDPYGTMKLFYGAPLVVFISSNSLEHMQLIDCGIAVENLAIAAKSMGLDSVIVGRPKYMSDQAVQEFASLYQQPEGYHFAIAIAIGHGTAKKEPHKIDKSKVNIINPIDVL